MNEVSWNVEIPTEHMKKVFGMQDIYLKKLEKDFQVSVVDRNEIGRAHV